jgi:galactose mutarotase-like enzyme
MHSFKKIVQNKFEIIQLKNDFIAAEIVVNIGNTLVSVKNEEVERLFFPFSLQEYKSNTKLAGNPFMHPWANRLEGEYLQIENAKYDFPREQLHLLYRDGNNLPLHGLILKSDKWKTIELHEEENYCYHLAEFAFDDQNNRSIFPFKHRILMKHLLQGNELKIETTVINEDEKELPLSFGFHPYFIKTDKDLKLKIPANNVIEVNDSMIPTGNIFDKSEKWNFKLDEISLDDNAFDDGFQDLKFDENKQAVFSFDKIKLIFGEDYSFAQIYAPLHPEKPYVCIEPMTAPTNALNTNNCIKIKSGEKFTASFAISLNT